MKHALTTATFGLVLAAAGACSTETEQTETDELGFPLDEGEAGKADAFGRSLVGSPNAYEVDPRALSDASALEQELKTNYRARRQFGWQVALKALEPVPLLALADQLDALPDCPQSVDDRSLDKCGRQTGVGACGEQAIDGFAFCGWDDNINKCAPVCDNLKLADGGEIPKIPRFQTWYGVEDLNNIFKTAYGRLDEEAKLRRDPVSDHDIGEAFWVNNNDKSRISTWPLRRYTAAVEELFGCMAEQKPGETDEAFADRCAQERQSQFSGASGPGGGIARILYSPAMAMHTVKNYGQVLDCADDMLPGTWCAEGEPCNEAPDNFSTCFTAEFPVDAGSPFQERGLPAVGGTAVIKTTWSRVGFGFELPAYDTDSAGLQRHIAPDSDALWSPKGDRKYAAPEVGKEAETFPTAGDIYTIQTRGGAMYRMTGMHIMTKELRHWVWVTLWWSDKPDDDFGADRPAAFGDLEGAWSNYKMCVVADYLEGDPDAAGRFADTPSLQQAIAASGGEAGQPTWCSNPYIEMGEGNARTNCVGCHQHAGTRFDEAGQTLDLKAIIAKQEAALSETNRYPANGRVRRRNTFATDYSWAFSRIDDLTELIRREIEVSNVSDERWARLARILGGTGDVQAGEAVFRTTTPDLACTKCHGESGEGGVGPNFEQLFAQKTDWELLYTIIEGRGVMPTWGETLTDQQLTDLMAFLSTTFDDPAVH